MKLSRAIALVASASLTGAVFVAVAPATAEGVEPPTRVLSGTGWKANTDRHIESINPGQTYTLTFSSQTVKTRQAAYLAKAIPEIRAAGVDLVVGGIETVDATKCPAKGHIQIEEKYRPLNGAPGMSRALPCYDTTNNSAWGGIVQMDSEYYNGTWSMSTALKWNATPHEVVHVLGLDHPNYDKDGDGSVENFECVATSYGNTPLMCSPNGGYQTEANRGTLVGYDEAGIGQLVTNFGLEG